MVGGPLMRRRPARWSVARGLLLAGVLPAVLPATAVAGHWLPSGAQVAAAAQRAWQSPQVWVPAAGAALLLAGEEIDGLDRGLSDWAREHAPLFGTPERAASASDDLLATARAIGVLSVVVTPAATDDDGLAARLHTAAVQGSAVVVTLALTDALKEATDRARPEAPPGTDGGRSFPSGHAAQAAVWTTLAGRNAAALPLSPAGTRAVEVTRTALTVATGWARVEAGKHYASDVLAGAALGNFVGAFVNDAFLGFDGELGLQWLPGGGVQVAVARAW